MSPNPEELARQQIDAALVQAGWTVQDRGEMNLGAGRGVAVREFPLASGPVDYLMFVDRQAVGHYGTGDPEVVLRSRGDLEKAKPLLQASYEAS